MTIGVIVDGRIVQRPYSVASPPAAVGTDGYEFYVRLVQGGTFTPLLWDLPVGPPDADDRPEGQVHARAENDERTHIFISSGTGNAPFVSMMRQLLVDGRPRKVVFLNGGLVRARARLPHDPRGLGAVGRLPGHATSRPCRARRTR